MSKRECMRIEIAECPWTEELRFRVRFGDMDGSTEASNLDSVQEVLNYIKMEMEINWPEFEKLKKKKAKGSSFGKPES